MTLGNIRPFVDGPGLPCNKLQRGGRGLRPRGTLGRCLGSVAIRYSQNTIKQSSQTASFRGMSSIRSRSRRPMGHPSHIAQACDFRPGNRMTLSMLAPERYLILSVSSVKFNQNIRKKSQQTARTVLANHDHREGRSWAYPGRTIRGIITWRRE